MAKKNYPSNKPSSDLDIGIPDLTSDDKYLYLLKKHLNLIFEDFQPDFVFYQSGVDVLKSDKLGRLSLTISGCMQRDELVYRICKKNNVSVTTTMGGGYSENIKIILDAHCNTFKTGLANFF